MGALERLTWQLEVSADPALATHIDYTAGIVGVPAGRHHTAARLLEQVEAELTAEVAAKRGLTAGPSEA